MAVNITRYKDGLIYTFDAQAIHHLSSYVGFILSPLPSSKAGVKHIFLHIYHIIYVGEGVKDPPFEKRGVKIIF